MIFLKTSWWCCVKLVIDVETYPLQIKDAKVMISGTHHPLKE